VIGALVYGYSGHWYRKADVGHRSTYLAIRGGGNVKIHDVKYHGDESGHAREGVKLQKEQINQRLQRGHKSPSESGCHYEPISSGGTADVLG
jgi:type VI protein secretion system component Hcp